MAISVVSGVVSSTLRMGIGSGVIPRRQFRFCPCAGSRGVQSFFPANRQLQNATKRGMRSSLVTYRTSIVVRAPQNWLDKTCLERRARSAGLSWIALLLGVEKTQVEKRSLTIGLSWNDLLLGRVLDKKQLKTRTLITESNSRDALLLGRELGRTRLKRRTLITGLSRNDLRVGRELDKTRVERRSLIRGSSSRNDLFSGRDLQLGNEGRDGCGSKEAWTTVRAMGSSKAKGEPRGSLWRTRSVISKETIQAVHDLKRYKNSSEDLAKIFQTRIPRLLKMDLLATLSELQRQNEIELALQIFDMVRKEAWYKPDQFLYRSMMDALGRNRRITELEKKFQELQDEGIRPELPIYRELVGGYVRAHMLPEALATHAKMVESGCGADTLSLQFIATAKEKEAVRIKQRNKAEEKMKAEQEKEQPPSIVQL